MSDSTPLKRCSKCGIEYPATPEYFTRCKSSKDGLYWRCKTCRKEERINHVPTLPMPEEKQCNKCGIIKPIREFHKQKCNPDGYHHTCKACRAEIEGFNYIKPVPDGFMCCSHCGKVLPATNEYFITASRKSGGISNPCKECYRIYQREWRSTPEAKEATRISNAKWRNKNREHMNRLTHQWGLKNKLRRNLSTHRRLARKQALPDTFTVEHHNSMMTYWNNACAISGETENLHIDHWQPLNSPDCPGTVPENMIPLTSSLNLQKSDKDPVLWLIQEYGVVEAFKILQRIQDYFDWIKTQQ